MRNIKICDTTLRDCEHSAEFSMSVREKVEIAKQIERLGADIIEVTPNSDAVEEIAKELNRSIFSIACTLSEFESEEIMKVLLSAASARVNFLIHENRGEDYQNRVESLVKIAKENRLLSQLTVDALSMEKESFLIEFCDFAKKIMVDSICVYDNTGYSAPTEFFHIVKRTIDESKDIPVAVKCKNDLGMAVANALSAVKAGASSVECSVNGLGRRAGNAALEQVVMGISARGDYYDAETGVVKRLLYRTGKMVSAVVGVPIPSNAPIVGDRSLTDAAVVIDEQAGFKSIQPNEVGIIRNNLVLGSRSSKKNFDERVDELGYLLSSAQSDEAYTAFKDLAERKDVVTDRDIEAIVAPMDEGTKRYELISFVINTGNEIVSTATVSVLADNAEKKATSEGFGPVDAAFKAIDKISGLSVALEDFYLQSVTEGEDALGDAFVKIRGGDRVFTGRGVSTDIVEASIRAYVNALNKVASVQ